MFQASIVSFPSFTTILLSHLGQFCLFRFSQDREIRSRIHLAAPPRIDLTYLTTQPPPHLARDVNTISRSTISPLRMCFPFLTSQFSSSKRSVSTVDLHLYIADIPRKQKLETSTGLHYGNRLKGWMLNDGQMEEESTQKFGIRV